MRGRIVILSKIDLSSISYDKYTIIVMRKTINEIENILSFLHNVKRLPIHVENDAVEKFRKTLRLGEPDVIFGEYEYDPNDTIVLLNDKHVLVLEIWKDEPHKWG